MHNIQHQHVLADPQLAHWIEPSIGHPFHFSKLAPQLSTESPKSIANNPKPAQEKPSSRKTQTTSSRAPKHAWLWGGGGDGRSLSDVSLRIRPLPSAKGENVEELAAKAAEPSAEDCEFQLHTVVLAANSLLFRFRLLGKPLLSDQLSSTALHSGGGLALCGGGSSAMPSVPEGSEGCAGPRVLEERVLLTELPAAIAVLQHMYTEELVWDSPAQLVTVLKIADKWKAEDCIDACRYAFAQLRPEEIDLEVIRRVYSLEGIVGDVANFAEIVTMTQSRLVQMFKDIVEVVRNPALHAQFLQLPFAAVLALLRSEELVVDCENSVVVVASLWVMRGRGRFSTPEQRRFLAGAIRLSALTPSYLCGVLPNLRWFTWPTAAPGFYYSTLQSRLVTPEARQVLLANVRPSGTGLAPGGEGAGQPGAAHFGLAEPERRVVREQNLELVCDIDYARLSQYLEDGHAALLLHPEGFKGVHVHSECSFFRGYLWGIKVVFGFSAGPAKEGPPAFTVTPSVFAAMPPGEEALLPLITPVTVSFKCKLEAVGPYGSPYASATFPGASFMRPGDDNVSSIGISNFWKKITVQERPESWKPYLVGGKLRLKLVVQGSAVE